MPCTISSTSVSDYVGPPSAAELAEGRSRLRSVAERARTEPVAVGTTDNAPAATPPKRHMNPGELQSAMCKPHTATPSFKKKGPLRDSGNRPPGSGNLARKSAVAERAQQLRVSWGEGSSSGADSW
jgi:hypothetical protein